MQTCPINRNVVQRTRQQGRTHRTVLERTGVWEEIRQRRTGRFDTVYLDDAGRELAVMTGEFTGGRIDVDIRVSHSVEDRPHPLSSDRTSQHNDSDVSH